MIILQSAHQMSAWTFVRQQTDAIAAKTQIHVTQLSLLSFIFSLPCSKRAHHAVSLVQLLWHSSSVAVTRANSSNLRRRIVVIVYRFIIWCHLRNIHKHAVENGRGQPSATYCHLIMQLLPNVFFTSTRRCRSQSEVPCSLKLQRYRWYHVKEHDLRNAACYQSLASVFLKCSSQSTWPTYAVSQVVSYSSWSTQYLQF